MNVQNNVYTCVDLMLTLRLLCNFYEDEQMFCHIILWLFEKQRPEYNKKASFERV